MIPRYYVFSGRVGSEAPLRVFLFGGFGAALLAAIYAVVIRYNPFVYVSFIATVFFGMAVGTLAVMTAESGRSRSRSFNLLAALALASFALWLHWLIWVMLELDSGVTIAGQLATSGLQGWRNFLGWLVEHYHLSVSRWLGAQKAEASTNEMSLIWALEAIAIVGLALVAARLSSGSRPFSELTQKWAETTLKTERADPRIASDALRAALERGDFSALKQLARVDEADHRSESEWKSLEIELLAEPDDPEMRVLSVVEMNNRWSSKGKRKSTSKVMVERLLISPTEYDALFAVLYDDAAR
ncbi:hypothetical protein HT746_05795 [Burkholderia pyrrocinia]|uniref:hypothetical protein n=1 Tax=Burkholderia pyrrocinia TaxID=60550 RepID=UPI0015777127|nr:hypothetical protein [Burkholderia pyrrocinia]NTX26656.1 hypothetical protein [Burkholderia pyrrocinia]